MTVRICVAISEKSTAEAIEAARRATEWADLVEIRGDYIRDLDLDRLLRHKPCPLIFTLRASNEGGKYEGPEDARLATIIEAAKGGADYVDVEYSAKLDLVLEHVPRERVILSSHNFEGTPPDLERQLETMAATGCGILKLVCRARSLMDNLRVARVLSYGVKNRWRVIAFAMGIEGIPSRILSPLWGSYMTFASLPGSAGTAEGQLPADQMVHHYRVRRIGSNTRLYGVVGKPIGHSLSPLVHNAACGARDIDAAYFPLEASSVEDFLEFGDALNLQGASVTIPYKEAMAARAQRLSQDALGVGAVNTFVRRDREWHGDNTDVAGFLEPLRIRMRVAGKRVVVLGCGGSARAIVFALRAEGASVAVVARDETRGRALSDRFGASYAPWNSLGSLRWDVLVNTTPIGMYPNVDESPVSESLVLGEWVYDLVYNPCPTRLLRDAANRGCKTISGKEMFLEQALRQQRLWFGPSVPIEVMREALNNALLESAPSAR